MVSESKHSIQLNSVPRNWINLSISTYSHVFNILDCRYRAVFDEHTIPYGFIDRNLSFGIYSIPGIRLSNVCRMNKSARPQNGKDLVFPMENLHPVEVFNRETVIKIPPVENWEYELKLFVQQNWEPSEWVWMVTVCVLTLM